MRGGGFCLCPAVGREGVRVHSSHVPTVASQEMEREVEDVCGVACPPVPLALDAP